MSTHESRSGLRPISVGDLSDELPSHGYPLEMVEIVEAANGQHITVRPILPLDAAKFQAFVRNLSDASRSNRFLHSLKELPGRMLQRLTRTHMALVAEIMREGVPVIIAEARYACDPESGSVELAVAVADNWQGLGLAKALFRRLIGHAASAGFTRLTAETRASNVPVLHLAREAEFSIRPLSGASGVLRLTRNIAPHPHLPQQEALTAAE
jgi:acetyltransferase